MGLWGTIITATALSADAFAVALGKGMAARTPKAIQALVTGIYFGIFQALMTLLGFGLGQGFQGIIGRYAPLAASAMLAIIGINMLRESRNGSVELNASFGIKAMLPLAIATSIDAFAAGTGLALLGQTDIICTSLSIGIITLALSTLGVTVGRILGTKLKIGAEILGGIILLLMSAKALLDFILNI